MHTVIFLLLTIFFISPVSSQVPSPKEMQAQMKEAINELNKQITDLEKQVAEAKKNKEDASVIKDLEDQMATLKKQVVLMEGFTKDVSKLPASTTSNTKQVKGVEGSRFPKRKTALLASLPKRIINKQELTTFLTSVNTELKKKLPAEKVSNAQKIITQVEGNIENAAITGVMAWYSNAPSDALLLLTYAASKSADANTLNNCAAIFNLCGLEDKAIPVLKYVLAAQPENSTILNNIGQAFAGLGELDSAMNYFRACMVQNSSHPEACATAAYIEAERGNTAEAAKLMSQALKTGYSDARVKFLDDINPNNSLSPYGLGDIDLKGDYYMRGDFNLPPNCRNWNSCEDVTAKQKEFSDIIDKLTVHYTALVQQYGSMTLTGPMSPWNNAATYKMGVISSDYEYRRRVDYEILFKRITEITEASNLAIQALDKRYEPIFEACSRSSDRDCFKKAMFNHCQERKAIDNRYFNELADAAENFQINWYPQDLEYHNKIIWLMGLRSTDNRFLQAESATQTLFLLQQLKAYVLSACDPAGKPDCEQYNPANPANQSAAEYYAANCPINIIVPAGPLKMNLNCKQFKIDATAFAIVFSYEKDFISKESTIAVGPGASIGNPYVIEAGVKAQAYVKFDGNNQPIDAGVQAEVELEVTGPISPVIKTGFTVGVSSGVKPTGQLTPFVGMSTYAW